MCVPEIVLYAYGLGDAVIFGAQKRMLLRYALHRVKVKRTGYRILHLTVLCLSIMPDPLPSVLAQKALWFPTTNQSGCRQTGTRNEPHSFQIITSELELFPSNAIKEANSISTTLARRQAKRLGLIGVQQDLVWQPVKHYPLIYSSSSLHFLHLFPPHIFNTWSISFFILCWFISPLWFFSVSIFVLYKKPEKVFP